MGDTQGYNDRILYITRCMCENVACVYMLKVHPKLDSNTLYLYVEEYIGIGALLFKIIKPNLVTYVNWSHIFELCMLKCGSKNGRHKAQGIVLYVAVLTHMVS